MSFKNNFVWKGLNLYYFWLSDSPDLTDDRFASDSDYDNFINSFNSPEAIFNHLLVDPTIDRYSVIFSDYTVLEQILSGTQKSNGVDYELRFKTLRESLNANFYFFGLRGLREKRRI